MIIKRIQHKEPDYVKSYMKHPGSDTAKNRKPHKTYGGPLGSLDAFTGTSAANDCGFACGGGSCCGCGM